MKPVTLAVAALAALSSPLFAGGPVLIAEEPEPTPAPMPAGMPVTMSAGNWAGPYVGLAYGKTAADLAFSFDDTPVMSDGSALGLFGGYLFQTGALVYGGEVAIGKVSDTFVTGGFGDDDVLTKYVDLKAKVGYATDRTMIYGLVGYSKSQFDDYSIPDVLFSSSEVDGLALGVGADLKLTEDIKCGVEYVTRDMSGDYIGAPGTTLDVKLDTLSVRLAMSF